MPVVCWDGDASCPVLQPQLVVVTVVALPVHEVPWPAGEQSLLLFKPYKEAVALSGLTLTSWLIKGRALLFRSKWP